MLAYYGPEWESLQSRIVGRWCPSFTGNTGLQLPDTTGRNHGTLNNFANNGNDAYVASPDKLALNFDGTNDFVKPDNVRGVGTGNFSVFAWIRHSVSARRYVVASNLTDAQSEGHWLAVQSNQVYSYFGTELSVTATGFTLADNQWHFIGVTRVGTTGTAFVDGRQIGSPQAIGGFDAGKGNFRIGARGDDFIQHWQGQLDDITIFNAALTANEVRFIYDQGRGGGLLMQPPRRRSVAAVIAALVLACETANYSLTGQAAGLFASRVLAADQAQYILSGNAANITASRLLSADPASYTATGNEAATICARLLDGGAAAYALTGTDAGLIANRKLTADQAVYFLAGNNAELLRSLKLNAGSMALQLDNFAASLLADRKISADGAQYILVVSDANLGDSASGVAPYYYLFMLRGPQ
jgi:hypothetical protein